MEAENEGKEEAKPMPQKPMLKGRGPNDRLAAEKWQKMAESFIHNHPDPLGPTFEVRPPLARKPALNGGAVI